MASPLSLLPPTALPASGFSTVATAGVEPEVDRLGDGCRKDPGFLATVLATPETRVLVHQGPKRPLITQRGRSASLCWTKWSDLAGLGVSIATEGGVTAAPADTASDVASDVAGAGGAGGAGAGARGTSTAVSTAGGATDVDSSRGGEVVSAYAVLGRDKASGDYLMCVNLTSDSTADAVVALHTAAAAKSAPAASTDVTGGSGAGGGGGGGGGGGAGGGRARARGPSFRFTSLRRLLGTSLVNAGTESSILGQAVGLLLWHTQGGFCGKCGAATGAEEGGMKRACTGAGCGMHVWPRTDPVVIALVVDKATDRGLLQRNSGFPPGMYTCVSGFVDCGETIEEAVAREVKEETGVDVHSVQYLGSQPWPAARGSFGQLMIGCVAYACPGDGAALAINTDEIEDACWFTRGEVAKALEHSMDLAALARRTKGGDAGDGDGGDALSSKLLFVPPSWAIAHMLIRHWLQAPTTAATPASSL